MTVSSTTVKNSYSGNGSTTEFAYTFKIFADTDLQVIIRVNSTGVETVKTLTTHYTVAGAGDASGGSITFTSGNTPASGETVVIIREVPQTQAIDYIANDPFPAESHEEGLDRATMTTQQVQEELDRSIKLSRTNTMTSTEFTVGATDRANKILAFDSSGEISVTQELGTYQGTDATTTTAAYTIRDIIKSTTAGQLNNVYICTAASVIGDLLTDTDHFELLVDAYSAATSATNAAASEAAAASSATDAQTAQTAAELAETNAETAETNAETAETNAATSATNAAASESAAATSETNAATSETNAATSESNASTSASTATTQASNASTSASNAATSESNASTSASNAATSESNAATSETNAATSETNASNSATAAAQSATDAANSADAFDDVYLGSKSSDPTVDNDGDALAAGMLYYNTSSNIMRIYSGSAWENVAVSTSGFATLAGVETLTNKTLTEPKIGTSVLDTNGNELLKLTATSSAVNELTYANAATGNKPTFTASGGDTNIGISIQPKGSGQVTIDNLTFPAADGSADQVLKTDGSGNLSFTDVSGGTSWQSVKTSGFTAVSGEGYPCDTSSSAFTVTLPSSANIGDYVVIADYGNNASSNNITIDPNGSKILGSTGNRKIQTNKEAIKLVYIDATKGWIGASGYVEGTLGLQGVPDAPTIGTATATSTTTATVSFTAPTNNGDSTITSYTATSNPSGGSGTLSQAGSGTISVTGLTGNTSYTFTVTATNSIGTSVASAASNSITTPNTYSADMLIIAGGGGGGAYYYGGGGGAGGYRTSTQTLTGGATYTITVGDGGAGSGVNNTRGGNGSDSSISGSGITTITSTGGGGGGSGGSTPNKTGKDGGSGGGSAYDNSSAGSGNTPSTSPSQGNDGGLGFSTPGVGNGGGGGGGAGAVGQAGYAPNNGGNGGNGLASSITGSSVTRAGGGGGADAGGTDGSGGTGGGGNAGFDTGGSGTVNTGSGGGAQGYPGGGGSGDGGKGVVILSVPTANYSGTTTGSPTVTTSGSNTIMQFNGSGSYTA